MIVIQPRHPVEIYRDQIASQVEQFLAAGGAIQPIPTGLSGEKQFSIWTRGVMVVSDEPQPERRRERKPQARPGAPSMKAANEGKRKAAKRDRALLAVTARSCAKQGFSISATAESMGISRVTLRKIATEHGIEFKSRTIKQLVDEFLQVTADG